MIGGILDLGSEDLSPEIGLWVCASDFSSGYEHRSTCSWAGVRSTNNLRTAAQMAAASVSQSQSPVYQDVFIVTILYQILHGPRAQYLDLWGIMPALKKALSSEKFNFCTPHPIATECIHVVGSAWTRSYSSEDLTFWLAHFLSLNTVYDSHWLLLLPHQITLALASRMCLLYLDSRDVRTASLAEECKWTLTK